MNADLLKRMATDPALFRENLILDREGEPVRFGDVVELWQAEDFEALDPAWTQAAGRSPYDPQTCRRAYLERPRGHSKTSDLSVMATYALAFAKSPLVGIAAAADRDQAQLLRHAIERLVLANPWLSEAISVRAYEVEGRNGSRLSIISADAGSAYGFTPDFLVVDELTHWPQNGEKLWHALISAAAKKTSCIVMVISNAGLGMGSSWQWNVRESVRQAPTWHFSRLDGPRASWITPERLDEQKRLLPPAVYSRLWLNEWSADGGDALSGTDIDQALKPELHPLDAAEPNTVYALGVDLGIRNDATAVVVVGRNYRTGRYRLAAVHRWQPTAGRPVSLGDVEETITDVAKRFRSTTGQIDGWQAEMLVERLKAKRINLDIASMNLSTHDKLARHLVSTFTDGIVDLYDHPRLMAELRTTCIEERFGGKLKLTWPRDEHGHGDTACAFCLALESAHNARPPANYFVPRVYKLYGNDPIPDRVTAKRAVEDMKRWGWF